MSQDARSVLREQVTRCAFQPHVRLLKTSLSVNQEPSGAHMTASDSREIAYWARVAGVMYLCNYATAIAGTIGMEGIRGSGTFAEQALRLSAAEPLYRAAITSMAVSWVFLSVQAFALYKTVATVNRSVAQVALLLMSSQAVIGAVSLMFGLSIMSLRTGAASNAPLANDQLQMLTTALNAGYHGGFQIAMLFFAAASVLFFYLFYRSGFFPAKLAMLGMLGCALMVPASMAALISPTGMPRIGYAAWATMGIAEVSTGLWLAFRGIRIRPAPGGALGEHSALHRDTLTHDRASVDRPRARHHERSLGAGRGHGQPTARARRSAACVHDGVERGAPARAEEVRVAPGREKGRLTSTTLSSHRKALARPCSVASSTRFTATRLSDCSRIYSRIGRSARKS